MNYPTLNVTNKKFYETSPLCGGIALGEDPSLLDDGVLSDCNNMWFKRGALTTRPGMGISENSLLCDAGAWDFVKCPLKFTDTFADIDGSSLRLAYFVNGDSISYGDVHIYTLSDKGEINSIGSIHYSRISSDSFADFEHIHFIVGAKTRGCGIYALLTRRLDSTDGKISEIYECSEDRSEWFVLDESDFYIPVIYMNGRGDRYGFGPDPYKPEPYEPESLNLLTGAFKAYFTTDNYSSTFSLPISGIDQDREIVCRLYETRSSYTQWKLEAGQDDVKATIWGAEITMKFNRSTGVLSFFTGNEVWPAFRGTDIIGNNLVIKAYKSTKNGFNSIVGSRRSAVWGSRVFVCGGYSNVGTVYSARITNPLYFPKNCAAVLGDPDDPITAIGVQNDKPVAFKDRSIYRIVVDRGITYTTNAFLPEGNGEITRGETVYTVGIHTEIGCDCPDTLKLCGNRLVWLNSEGKVYVLATTTYGKENNIYCVSEPIADRLKTKEEHHLISAFAAENDGYYMLVTGDGFENSEVFLMDYRVKAFGQSGSYLGSKSVDRNLAWYEWSFPKEVILSSACSSAEGFVLGVKNINYNLTYFAKLNAKEDSFFDRERFNNNADVIRGETSVKSGFTTKLYDFAAPHFKKDITDLFVCAKCEEEDDVMVEILDEFGVVGKNRCRLQNRISSVRLMPYVRGVFRMAVRIVTDKKITVAPFTIGYRINALRD